MKKKLIIGAVIIACMVIGGWYLFGAKSSVQTDVLITPKNGEFVVSVETTGELQAKNSIDIRGPENARAVGIWQMKILNLVTEGTVVKKGDFVAEIDKSELVNKIRESELNFQKNEAQYTQAQLDSTLALTSARDELVNLKYGMEEKRILKEQSIYEAPAIRRQAEIDYERSERNYQQAIQNYQTKRKQSVAKMQSVGADLEKERQRLEISRKTATEFTILAPAPGMVIYAREWNGRKKVIGSTVNAWDPTVATLPDLSQMESVTYINEVDIKKIKVGQSVNIKLDADASKRLTGKITSVANIGEQRPNSDSKVFEVRILVSQSDTTLRPSMTTGNEIIIETISHALSIQLECIHTEDTISYVYKKNNGRIVRQQVELGAMNENGVVVKRGLDERDLVFISRPQDVNGVAVELLSK
jgi:multidrug efflux pump subunit AcrA (membrane-fusion protein)